MDLVIRNLDVPFHLQDYGDYCSAACEMMVLHSRGIALADCNQDDLMGKNYGYDDPVYEEFLWGADPPALAHTLRDFVVTDSFGKKVKFKYHALKKENLISKKIIETLDHPSIAPIALVYEYRHWLVVRGYVITTPHVGLGEDTSYNILGFIVNNPLPPRSSESDGDRMSHCDFEDICIVTTPSDRCGDGVVVWTTFDWPSGTPHMHIENYGIADQYITYNCWRCDYMTGVPPIGTIPELDEDPGETPAQELAVEPTEEPPPPWDQRFVAVCAYEVTASPPTTIISKTLSATVTLPNGKQKGVTGPRALVRSQRPGWTRINVENVPPQNIECDVLQPIIGTEPDLDLVRSAAISGLVAHGLAALGPVWQAAIAAADAGIPSLVSHLDLNGHPNGSKYYLVPLRVGRDNVPVVVRIDAYSHEFLEAVAVSSSGSVALPSIDDTLGQVYAHHIMVDLGDGQGPVELNAGNYDTLVWTPCLESFSPFYPFFHFTPNHQDVFLPLDVLIRLSSNADNIVSIYRHLTTESFGR